MPYVFTEHGAVMLAAVLRTPVAVSASIQIARAFVKLREVLSANKDLAKRLDAVERQLAERADALGENVGKIAAVLTAIKRLMEPPPQPPEEPHPPIGFIP